MPRRPRQRPPEEAPPASDTEQLAREVSKLRAEVARLNGHRFMRIQNSAWRLIGHQVLSGLFLGLGTVLGATILVSVLAYFLSQIELLPLVGEWASEVLRQIEEQRTR